MNAKKDCDAPAPGSSNDIELIIYAQMIIITISDMPRCHNEGKQKDFKVLATLT